MANIIADNTWHGNPRPIESYVSTVFDETVESPYYAKTMAPVNVPVHRTYNTAVPLTDLAPTAAALVPGPALLVQGAVGGLWSVGSGINVAITVTGGTNISTAIVNQTELLSSDQFAAEVAGALNTIGAGDIQCAPDGEVVNISALGAVTALTITTWAVIV